MTDSFLDLYLFMNLLLAGSWAAFALGRRILVSLRLPHQPLVRWAQVLVLISVLAPLALAFTPSSNLPPLKIPTFRSGSEESRVSVKSHADFRVPFASAVSLVTVVHTPTWTETLLRELRRLGSSSFVLEESWLLGLLWFGSRFVRHWIRLRTLLRESSLVRRVGRIRICASAEVSVPLSAWLGGSRWVILPESIFLRRQDLRLALMHELQHHRQADTHWAMWMEIMICLFYWNPAAYRWRREINELQEFSCDEAIVGRRRVSPREYGSCLVRVAETALAGREIYAGTSYMAAVSRNPSYLKSFLRRRIEMIASSRKSGTGKWASIGLGVGIVMVTITAAFGMEKAGREGIAPKVNEGTLVVNESIQKIAEKILVDAIKSQKASEGFAVVADPLTGRILAVANVDARKKKQGFWSLAQRFEPASIAKTLIVAEAIEDGTTTPREQHFCENGRYKFAGKTYHDWRETGYGYLSTTQTIARSSDICTVKIAEKLGEDRIRKMLKNFGFGPEGTASAFPGSVAGELPSANSELLIPEVSYGQGFTVTPIEMIQAYGAIANGGNLLAPIAANAPDSERKVIRRVLSEENAEKMKAILREVVLTGTGRSKAVSQHYTTAGKTATSFAPDLSELDWMGGKNKSNVGGFIGFAPVDNPRVEIYVSIRDSHTDDTGAHGATHAAPIFLNIAESVLKEMNVAPDKMD